METLFWKAIVEIIQIPNDLSKIYNNGPSWLSNPLSDHRVYGTKFSIGADGFSWKFYLNSKTEDGKRVITHAIFQIIRTLLPELRINELKYVIILDEAHEISEKTKYQSNDDDETVTRHYLEIVFEKLLRAFRSGGVCLLLADHLPNNLFEGVYKLPSIKVIFRSDKDFLHYISNYPEEQDDLANQKNRKSLILDGVNARKFAIHTIDYSYQKQINEFGSSLEINCPNCKDLLEVKAKFCHKCGKVNVE